LYRNPSYITKAIVAVCMVAVLFAIATQMAYASSKSAPRPYKTTQISLKESASPGTLCLGDIMGYQVTSTVLGDSTYVECNGTVTAIDVVNRIYYCTSGIPSLDICFNWQLKTIASSCVGGPTTILHCPPSPGQDTYSVGTNQLWRFQSSVCVEFVDGETDCGTGAVDIAF